MSIYFKQIEQLVALQRVDSEILDLVRELEKAPLEVTTLEASHQEALTKRVAVQEKIDYLSAQQTRLDHEIEEDNLKIKKSKNKLMMVNNTKEYHAMMREMDNLEKLNRLREEEKAAMVEELVRQTQALEELDKSLAELGADLDAKRSSLAERQAEAESRLKSLQDGRVDTGKILPAPVLSRYEFIRKRLPAPVIVPVVQGVCKGCHIAIPPQGFIELQRGKQILNCPNCQRLIYWCEHFNSPEDKAAAEAEALASTEA